MLAFEKVVAIARACILELFRRKDVYVALILAAVIVIPLSSISLFGVEGIVRYIREIVLLLIWAFSLAICVTYTARQVPGEMQRRTILPLLAKPIRRSDFVLGKFLGAALASSLALMIFYICYIILVGFKSDLPMTLTMLQAFILHLCFVVLLTGMTLFGSMILTPSANVACCTLIAIGMLLFGQRLPRIAEQAGGLGRILTLSAHWLAPHFEFFDLRLRLIHQWGALDFSVFLGIIAYSILYTAFFLAAAIIVFNRKRI